MYLTLKDGEPATPDIYIQSLPTRLPVSQQDLSVPSPANIYFQYAMYTIAYLALFVIGMNQFVKIKRH